MGAFKNLEDLVGDLQSGLVKLRAGELEPEELTPLVDDARELCDRLVLLRFKAHEFAYEVRKKAPECGVDESAADRQPIRPFRIGAAYQTSLIDAIEEVSREQAEQAAQERLRAGTPDLFDTVEALDSQPEQASEQESEPVKEFIKTEEETLHEGTESEETIAAVEAAEPPVNQEQDLANGASTEVPEPPAAPSEDAVSESASSPAPEPAVAEVEPEPEPEPKAEPQDTSLFGEVETKSLAEQMESQPIQDLRTAFSLVEKYECIKGLFDDDAMLFDRVLEAMDSAGGAELALHWLHQHVPAAKSWDPEDPTVMRFMERVQRRYA